MDLSNENSDGLTNSLTVGYHGTNEDNAKDILDNEFKPGASSGWLGSAIYFWLSKTLAFHWCSQAKLIPPAVIAAEIAVSSEFCLDLTESEGIEAYNQFVVDFCKDERNRKELDTWIAVNGSICDAYFVQMLFKVGPVKIVRFNAMASDAALEKPPRRYAYPKLPVDKYKSRFIINVRHILALKDNSLIRRKYRVSHVG